MGPPLDSFVIAEQYDKDEAARPIRGPAGRLRCSRRGVSHPDTRYHDAFGNLVSGHREGHLNPLNNTAGGRDRPHSRGHDMDTMLALPDDIETNPALAQAIVNAGQRRYFGTRRSKVAAFVDRNFSLRGSLRLHRAAVGWDIARAPFNLTMAAPQIGLLLAARAAGKMGASRAAATLGSKRLTVHTAVGRELAWRLHAELLELPFQDGDRITRRDALAETILADPRVAAALTPALEAIGTRGDDPALRRRLEAAMTEYTRTRAAATEITTALLSLGTGALALRKLTPGALSLGPTLAAAIARRAAVMSFPMGGALGSVWYTLFPVAPSVMLVSALTGGLLAASTVAAAFAGVVADPVQRRLGLHQRRLHRMLDALERQMHDPAAPGFVVHDHYVARLMDLFDVAGAIVRLATR
jgi:hypothetical protein